VKPWLLEPATQSNPGRRSNSFRLLVSAKEGPLDMDAVAATAIHSNPGGISIASLHASISFS
jgi:hypothetical protein